MSVFISIGCACNVKYQIDKHKGGKETLFFDWLITDMKSVVSILNFHYNIDELLNLTNIVKDKNNLADTTKLKISLTPLSSCIFLHDVDIGASDKDILDFIEKYKRRFYRIINYIKGKQKIYFLRCGNINNDIKDQFLQIIKTINPDCEFSLVSINVNQDNNNVIKHNNFLKINLTNRGAKYPNDWTSSYLDWKQIFLDIEKNV